MIPFLCEVSVRADCDQNIANLYSSAICDWFWPKLITTQCSYTLTMVLYAKYVISVQHCFSYCACCTSPSSGLNRCYCVCQNGSMLGHHCSSLFIHAMVYGESLKCAIGTSCYIMPQLLAILPPSALIIGVCMLKLITDGCSSLFKACCLHPCHGVWCAIEICRKCAAPLQ